jgi:hypothetical protein
MEPDTRHGARGKVDSNDERPFREWEQEEVQTGKGLYIFLLLCPMEYVSDRGRTQMGDEV